MMMSQFSFISDARRGNGIIRKYLPPVSALTLPRSHVHSFLKLLHYVFIRKCFSFLSHWLLPLDQVFAFPEFRVSVSKLCKSPKTYFLDKMKPWAKTLDKTDILVYQSRYPQNSRNDWLILLPLLGGWIFDLVVSGSRQDFLHKYQKGLFSFLPISLWNHYSKAAQAESKCMKSQIYSV